MHVDVQYTLLVQPVGFQGRGRFKKDMDCLTYAYLIRQHKLEFFLPRNQFEGCIQVNFYGDRHGGIKPYLRQICDPSVCLLI